MNNKVDEIVEKNVAKLSELNNYLIQGIKIVFAKDERRYNVSVTLQMFVDDEGNLKLIREV